MRSKPQLYVFSHICSPTYVTGAEKLLLFMLQELKPYFACTLVVPNNGYLSERAAAAGIPIFVLPVPLAVSLYLAQSHLLDELHQFRSTPEYAALVQLLADRRPDAVLVNTSVHPMPAIAAKELGIPVVWMLMETIRRTAFTAQAVGIIDQYADWIVGISESTLEPIQSNCPHRREWLLLPPSWNPQELQPASWPKHRERRRASLAIKPNQQLIGFIASSIYENKGYLAFMELAVEVAGRYPNAMFLLIGNPVDPPLFEAGLDLARNKGLLDRFRWIRFEEQIESVYPAFDMLVVPSLTSEGFGLTALEGILFGKPVVAFAAGGLAEIMRATGNQAYAVPTGYVRGLIAKVSELLDDRMQMEAVASRNSHAAEMAYGLAAYRSRLMKLLDAMNFKVQGLPHLMRGSTPTVYLFDNGKRRPFVSDTALLEAGYTFEQVKQVDDATLMALPLGEPIGTLAVQPVLLMAPPVSSASRKLRGSLRARRSSRSRRRGRQSGGGSRSRNRRKQASRPRKSGGRRSRRR
ncbi:glycosyl transferase group 1 [Paenibacillus curdlanolyticus YK9]|uniref:Glycosyl transferase group 1 n=1 Tax=Paenibacillus curdlanolyticus YK9 TaxID=717606 RepID=E0IFH9_9BACL|nr:glycosyltransferase family 4 protein [Paenibacillus curdlanolyticus]EFM08955.1 glycosyl transferase group 1 [Paenibacillus curdlanolyticus YK9]